MSTSSPPADIADPRCVEECNHRHCDEEYHPGSTSAAPFCSETCMDRADALGVLDDVHFDRRFCANCYTQIRETEEPGRLMRSRKVKARGYYRSEDHLERPVYTKDTEDKTAFFADDANRRHATSDATPTRHTTNDVGCGTCGALHHRTVDRPVSLDRLMDYAIRLADVVSTLEDERDYPFSIDRDTFLDGVRDRKSSPNNHQPDQRILEHAMADALE